MMEACSECYWWDAPEDQRGGRALCTCPTQPRIQRDHMDGCPDWTQCGPLNITDEQGTVLACAKAWAHLHRAPLRNAEVKALIDSAARALLDATPRLIEQEEGDKEKGGRPAPQAGGTAASPPPGPSRRAAPGGRESES